MLAKEVLCGCLQGKKLGKAPNVKKQLELKYFLHCPCDTWRHSFLVQMPEVVSINHKQFKKVATLFAIVIV